MPIPNAVWNAIKADMHAVTVLTHNGCHIHALSIVFSSIDKMAWLCSSAIDHTRQDFIAWVDNYFLPGNITTLNAIDLYAARCGFLHTGSAESKLYRDGRAKQILYSIGPRRPQVEAEAEIHSKLTRVAIKTSDVVVVQCIELLDLWIAAVQRFTNAIEADPALQTLTKQRAELQLAIFPAG